MIDQYVLATNDDGDLAIRTVSATESSSVTDTTSVITATDDGKLAVRVVGGGGGDQHNLGYYATPQALNEAHATAEAGDWAIVGSTDTVWIWDTDTSAWVDSDQKGQVTSVNGQTGAVTVQETLINQTNIKSVDGNSLLGSGNLELSTYLTYPAGWTTTGTTKVLCDDIAADTNATKGKAYLGEVTCSDLPASMANGEVVVEIMDGTTAANKVIVLTLTSGNSAPYMWKYTYWNGGTDVSGWQTWATSAQGAKADTAVQPGDLATVATTGAYSDLTGTPTIPAAQVNSDWNASSGVAEILNKPTLATVATSGAYSDLTGTPTIPAASQGSTMPTAGVGELDKIYQFIGTTDANYTNGYFYKCKAQGTDPETYAWEAIEVQAGGGGGGQNIQVSTLPTASATEEDNIYQFVGASGSYDGKYLYNGYFYKCENNSGTYSWNDIPTMRIRYFTVTDSVSSGQVIVGAVATYAGRCTNAVIIGNNAGYSIAGTPSNWYYSVIVGQEAKAHSYCVSIGYGAVAGRSNHIAIGYNAKNTTTSYSGAPSINIGGGTVPGDGSVAIGSVTNSVQKGGTAVGNNSKAGSYAVAVGSAAEATGGSSIAIRGKATATNAIQLGGGTNSEAGTFCVASKYNNTNVNYKMMDADGTIPEARLADTTSATAGDVLTLDSNGNAVWQAGGGGGGATATTATLATANWSSNSQTVSVTGVTASNVVYVMAAPASAAEYAAAGVQCTAQASGTLTFTCTTTPSSALTVNIAIF